MTQRINALENPQGKSAELLQAVEKSIGAAAPNFYKTFAQSPASFEAYLNASAALRGANSLSAELKEKLALTMAGFNGCTYCASAHSLMAGQAGIDDAERALNLQGKSNDAKDQAALAFALSIAENRGNVSDADFEAVRHAGYNDEQLIDILVQVGMNTLTNYFNEVFKTDVDFPLVEVK